MADWLYRWLVAREGSVIPRLGKIAIEHRPGHRDAYALHGALKVLQNLGRVRWRSETVSKDRGHQSIYLVDVKRELHTEGCPWSAE